MEESEKTALLAITVNLGIFAIKYAAAGMSGSIALKAEAFHTLADFVASLTAFAGLKIAKRKSKAFPYGLYKIENFMALFISLVILYTGYEIMMEVIRSEPVAIRNSGIAILSLLCAMAATFWFSRYEKKVGVKINSPILLADAAHIYTDVLSNTVVLAAVVSSALGFPLEKVAALIVVGFITKTGLQILKDGAKVLLDASLDYETLRKAEKLILNFPQVMELKSLKGRNSGRFKFIEANITLRTHDLDKAHAIADKIENQIKADIRNIDQMLIHYEPVQKTEIVYALPLTDDQGSVSSHFGEALSFLIVKVPMGEKITSQVEVLKNPYCKEEKGKGILAAEFLAEQRVDTVLLKRDFSSKGPSYVFSNANIEILLIDEERPEQAFAKIGITLEAH